jgi:hypothetical protein
MRNKILGLFFTLFALLFIYYNHLPEQNIPQELSESDKELKQIPQPTEIIKSREDRKEFKKRRKEWIKDMHKSHPDDDWEEMDRQTRREKAHDIIRWRKELLEAGVLVPGYSSRETAGGSVEGIWLERGSNNLSGEYTQLKLTLTTSLFTVPPLVEIYGEELYLARSGLPLPIICEFPVFRCCGW